MSGLNFDLAGNSSDFIKNTEQIRIAIQATAFESDKQNKVIQDSFSSTSLGVTVLSDSFKKMLDSLDKTEIIKQFASEIIRVRGEYQQLEATFKTLLQNKEVADTLMSQIVEAATQTPFSLSELAAGAKQLISYGFQAEEVNVTLERLGDVASGLGIPIEELIRIYGAVSSQGSLFATDLEQFTASGVPMLQGLADMFGVSTDKVNEMVSAGKIGFPEVQQVIENLTGEGGQFFNVMQEQSQTIVGKIDNLGDAWNAMLNEIGKSHEGAINNSIDGLKYLIDNYEEVGTILLGLTSTYGIYKAATIAYYAITKTYGIYDIATKELQCGATMKNIAATKLMTLQQTLLNKAIFLSPYVAVTAAVVGLGYAIYKTATAETELEKAHSRLNSANSEVESSLSSEVSKLTSLERKLVEAKKGTEEYENIKKTIVDNYGQYYDGLDGEIDRVGDLSTAYTQLVDNMRLSIGQRKFESFFKAEQDNLDNVISEKLDAAYTTLIDKFGKAKGTNLYRHFFDSAMRGTSLSASVMKELENTTFWDLKWGANAKDGLVDFRNNILNVRSDIFKEIKATEGNINEYKIKFGITDKGVLKSYSNDANKKKNNESKENEPLEKESNNNKNHDLDGQAENIYELQKRQQDLFDSQARERIRSTEDLWNEIWQIQINSMEEGNLKSIAQMELNHEKELQTIDRYKEDLLLKRRAEAEALFNIGEDKRKAEDSNYVRQKFDGSGITLDEQDNQQINAKYKATLDRQVKELSDFQKSVEDKYRDFNVRILKIEENGIKEIAELSLFTNISTEEIDRRTKVIQDRIKEDIQQINNEQSAEIKKDNPFLKQLFGDYSQMKFEDLQKLIEQSKQLKAYLSNDGNSGGLEFITEEQLSILKKSPAGFDDLKKALEQLLKGGKTNTWDDIFEKFNKGLAKLKASKNMGEVANGMKEIGEAASEASNILSGVAGSLSKMFEEMGNTEAAEAVSGVQDAMKSISNIGQGFAKGGIVGGVAAAVGEAANFIGKAFAANARHKAALKEIMNEATAQQREYNLLLLEQNLLYEKGTTIFGSDIYGKATNAVSVMKKAVEDLNTELKGDGKYKGGYKVSFKGGLHLEDSFSEAQRELYNSYAGLADVQIKTGHKKTGLFGWGKGKDTYSSILDAYPQLIDANGKFDQELAKTIINTREMSDESKNNLQYMIDLADQAKAAYEELNNYMTDIFGNLGSEMTDALVDAFKNGTDAAQSFTDSVTKMLETLAKQMVYSVTLAPLMEKAQNEMMSVMQDTTLSDEQRFKQWSGILNSLVDDAVNQQDLANRLLDGYQQSAAEKGFNIFDSDESDPQESTKGGFETMSQETGSELNGRFSAMQVANEEMRISMQSLVINLASLHSSVADGNLTLTEMRNVAIMSNSYLQDIAGYTKRILVDFGSKLDNIERSAKIMAGS